MDRRGLRRRRGAALPRRSGGGAGAGAGGYSGRGGNGVSALGVATTILCGSGTLVGSGGGGGSGAVAVARCWRKQEDGQVTTHKTELIVVKLKRKISKNENITKTLVILTYLII